MMLEDRSELHPARIDWWGNVIFAVGLVALLVGITYGIDPYGHHEMGWTNPAVLAGVIGGLVMLGIFCIIETRVKDPMFRVPLFRIRAFSMGNMASLLASLGRGGMMFILIIWLQGIWLPEHGYSFSRTPLWAGIYLVPLTIGFLIAGPISGILSDRGHGSGSAEFLATQITARELRLPDLRLRHPAERTGHGHLLLAKSSWDHELPSTR
jgi:hypothetical protein